MLGTHQARSVSVRPSQAGTIPMTTGVTTQQLDIGSLINLMIPVMMIAMVMKMAMGAMTPEKA